MEFDCIRIRICINANKTILIQGTTNEVIMKFLPDFINKINFNKIIRVIFFFFFLYKRFLNFYNSIQSELARSTRVMVENKSRSTFKQYDPICCLI